MAENDFKNFMISLLENYFEKLGLNVKTESTKSIYDQLNKSSKRTENKRKEALFTDLWNKECFMDIISDSQSVLKMEILSCYYISDENGKRVVFNISFNEYERNVDTGRFVFTNSERCEFFIKFYEKDGKADFVSIFETLYFEIEDLYEKKIVSSKVFSDFVEFGIGRYKNEDKGNGMKDFKETVKNIFGEEVADKAVELAKKLEKEFAELKDKASDKVEEVKPKVEQVKDKAKTVFETLLDELQNKSSEVKDSFNNMKEITKSSKKNKIEEDEETEEASELYNVTLTALEVFVANKVEINEHILQTIERYKQSVLGRVIEINGLNKNEDASLVISDSDFAYMLEVFLSEDGFIDDDTNITELEFVTLISFEGVENSSYMVAKMSVGEMMDIFIKFVPTYCDFISK